jgi:hypothetical protein
MTLHLNLEKISIKSAKPRLRKKFLTKPKNDMNIQSLMHDKYSLLCQEIERTILI